MSDASPPLPHVRARQDRRLGRTVLRTSRTTVDLSAVIPNANQPRIGHKEDPELQLQIEANEGIFEPLLLEPHPAYPDKYQIIDGDRRWTNSKILVEEHKKERYRRLPAEITDKTLDDEERLRVWIYIHRQRKEWDAREKEMVACRLVEIVGRASAANILGTTVRELDKLVEVYKLSERLKNIRDPSASITWLRQFASSGLLQPTISAASPNVISPGVIVSGPCFASWTSAPSTFCRVFASALPSEWRINTLLWAAATPAAAQSIDKIINERFMTRASPVDCESDRHHPHPVTAPDIA